MKFEWLPCSSRKPAVILLLTALFAFQVYGIACLSLETMSAAGTRHSHALAVCGLTLAVVAEGILVFLCLLFASKNRRIRFLLDTVQHHAEGSPSTQFEDPVHDDVGSLTEAFNTLTQRLDSERKESGEQRQAMEQASRNYMEMLGFVTSELRSTVSAALFNAHLLREGSYGSMTAEQTEGINHILDALESLDEITRNYLQLSRIEKGEMQVNRSDADLLEDVVRPVLAGFETQLNKREMPVRVSLPVGLRVPVDVPLLRVVYENLLGNALRYGKPSGIIELTATAGSDWVTLSVFNQGKEVPENALSSLFRKFQHYEFGGDASPKGPGLGLFIVQQIVSVHGGRVRLDSEAGSGTRVSFTLPL